MRRLFRFGLLICIVILCLPGQVWGNKFVTTPWTLSLNFGEGSSQQKWEVEGGDTSAIRNKDGPQFSLYLNWELQPNLSIVTGLRLVEKGITYDHYYYDQYGYKSGYDYFQEVIGYISVPILFKLKYPIGRFTPYLILGPRLDFNIYIDSSFEYISDLFEEFKNPVIGYDLGAGLSFRIFKVNSIYLEYSISEDFGYVYDKDGLKAKNYVVNILLGIEILKF